MLYILVKLHDRFIFDNIERNLIHLLPLNLTCKKILTYIK